MQERWTARPWPCPGRPQGDPPAVPWIDGRRMHVGERLVVLPVLRHTLAYDWTRVAPDGRGSISEVGDQVVHADARGHHVVRRPGGAVTWSAELQRVAWWDRARHRAVIVDATTGAVVRRVRGPFRANVPSAAGLLGPGDVVLDGPSSRFLVRRTSRGPATWFVDSVQATSARGRLVAGSFLGAAD